MFATMTPEQQKDVARSADPELRMVAIFRADLNMPIGKLAVQAGHAFLTGWYKFEETNSFAAENYMLNSQMKLVMIAPDLAALLAIKDRAEKRGVSSVMITDAGRTVFGTSTTTVLCLGPMSKTDSNALTRGLKLL